jgi:hypothetical protein
MAKPPRISYDHAADYRRFVIQKQLIERHFPCFHCRLSRQHLVCEGSIIPSEGCTTYTVSISYKQDGVPTVRIKEPTITPSARIHMYKDGTLCLYQPNDDPWKTSDDIHEKIIPWVAEWLVFYELFLMCGKWLGPEAEHGSDGKKQQTRTK